MRREASQGSRATIGVIGAGNMGSALVKGWLRSEPAAPDLVVWDKVQACVQRLPSSERLSTAVSLDHLAAKADVVVVVVKPKDADEVLGAIAGRVGEDQAVVSAMAGVTLDRMRGILGPGPALFRIMPNLGVELGVGAVALASVPTVSEADVQAVMELLEPLGYVEAVPEHLLDAVTAVSGSGPAFLALAMESLEDGAVAAGLSRPGARSLVRHAALETARLLPLYSDSPVELREHLMASGDTAQAGVDVLRARDVRAAFRWAVQAAMERSRQLRDVTR